MKTAIFFILNEYADWEGPYLSSQLNQNSEWTVKTASFSDEVTSIGGFKTIIDYKIDELPEKIDLLILIGGNSWDVKNETLKKLISDRLKNGQPVGAICGAVDYLAGNGLLSGYKHTGNSQAIWKNYSEYNNPDQFLPQQVVSDRNLVTANGTAALEFTKAVLKLIQFLPDKQLKPLIELYDNGFYEYCKKYGNPF
ncbi:type 1 glutamine amidotransferase family protein [Companilactobacillus kimchii]|uniref:4-methyl-5(B-hydroxyethyl)-thiazole monophosphate biosynthesis protein n=2 Tax=Companilactobacillus kimchii TaxID=2801452 RepID=A0ABR5NR89_9LACO|nr:type 1 glutamine amidotransferase family protein [Companilactobacillus kimchii]KAE9561392.1 glutamine amidotransferase [Companilactobacillus kimchii]KRK50286.1 4-methyl-5(B-hydroxyethyl)-thiazole monophosphate biosynthesis protein [Companilactobacillus kimchii DSM 13961 = JCM 10707]OWF31848.1 putative protease YdeA [Companilactobacillus kimchii]GEO48618.1 glutamine amidotransferase [Companilactobacillus paralimentarius]